MTPTLKALICASLAVFGGGAFASEGTAPDGVTSDAVSFAQVAALDGPAAALGIGMQQGINAAFEEVNRNGGVHGRRLNVDGYDDGYEPDRAVEMVRSVISGHAHLGFIGSVGTPTSKAVQPITTQEDMPFIGPFTGAGFLRNGDLTNVLNVRATYGAETEAWIAHLVDERGLKNIAILYQDDGFGRVGLAGVTAALDRRGMALVAEGTYVRNTKAVKSALLGIRKAKPDAVVMVGAYKAIGEFVRLSRKLKFDPAFVTISFVGSSALAADLGEDGMGVIVSQVVPFPWDASNPFVAEYQAALKAFDPAAEPGFVSLEGYIVGRLTIAALEKSGPNLTREGFLATMANLGTIDLGGVQLSYGPSDNQGMETVFLTRIGENGAFEPM